MKTGKTRVTGMIVAGVFVLVAFPASAAHNYHSLHGSVHHIFPVATVQTRVVSNPYHSRRLVHHQQANRYQNAYRQGYHQGYREGRRDAKRHAKKGHNHHAKKYLGSGRGYYLQPRYGQHLYYGSGHSRIELRW